MIAFSVSRYVTRFLAKNIKSRFYSHRIEEEQLFTCFQKVPPGDNLRSLKFVPKDLSPKILPKDYHNPNKQAMISQRMMALQNPDIGNPNMLTKQLKTLMNAGMMSFRRKNEL